MSLYLKIEQDDAYNFFVLYEALSPLRREIWNYTVWCVKHHTVSKPSQSHIAQKVGCSRSAVSEAFRIFKQHGWLYLTSRGWKRPKTLGIPLHLQQIDLVNRNYFRRVEATYRATHNYSNKINNTGKASEIAIPHYLQKKDLPLEVKLKLSLVPEYIFQETYYQCQKMAKNGFKPKEGEIPYFVGTALKMAKKNGHKLDWKAYYYTLKRAA